MSENWWVVFAAFLCLLFMFAVPTFMIPVLYSPIIDEFGWSRTQVTLFATVKFTAGAAIGVMVVIVAVRTPDSTARPGGYSILGFVRSGAFMTLALLGVLCAGLLLSGRMTIDPVPDASWVVLRRSGPPVAFWIEPSWGRSYHPLAPWEGVLSSLLLIAFYLPLDFVAQWVPGAVTRGREKPSVAEVPRRRADSAEQVWPQ